MRTSMDSTPVIRLSPDLDSRTIAAVYARHGRVHIPSIFPVEVAARIHGAMVSETPWSRVVSGETRHFALEPGAWEAVSAEKRMELEHAVHQKGQGGFAYFYDSFSIADLHEAGKNLDSYLMRVYEFLNSEPFLEFARAVTGAASIAFADAQATCYRSGDFLTAHDDGVEGKRRRAAYILNFTPAWRSDWGGLLQFLDRDGHVAEAYTPAFNALNLVRVPQPHAVSYVNPLAGAARYSITGWLRER